MSIEEAFNVEHSYHTSNKNRVKFISDTCKEFILSGFNCCKVTEIPDELIICGSVHNLSASFHSYARKNYKCINVMKSNNNIYLIRNNAKEN